jgi:6-phosphogluconolactonase
LFYKNAFMKAFTWIWMLLLFAQPLFSQNMTKEILYVGTYSQGGSEGVYVLEIDRVAKKSKVLQTVHDKQNPTFLTVHPNQQFLYVAYREGADASDKNGTIAAYRIDQSSGELSPLNSLSSMGESPCHVSVDPTGRVLFVSNYRGGNLAAFKINSDGSLAAGPDVVQHEGKSVHLQRQDAPYMHSMIPSTDGEYVYASDLGIDKIMIYKVDADSGKLTPAETPFVSSEAGAGPRHLVIHPAIPYGYSVEELSNTVAVYKVDQVTGSLTAKERVPMLSDEIHSEQNTAADIHISMDGRFLYASNRGQDNLAIYQIDPQNGQLSLIGHEPTGGKHPRNFKIGNQGELVFVANMHSDNIVVFSLDASTGLLEPAGWEMAIPQPACVEQIRL